MTKEMARMLQSHPSDTRRRRARRGASLIEMLVLLALLGLGVIAAVRGVGDAVAHTAAREALCIAQLVPCDVAAGDGSGAQPPAAAAPPKDTPDSMPPEFAGLQPCSVSSFEAARRESYTLGWDYKEFGRNFSHDKLSNGTEIIYQGNLKAEGRDLGAAVAFAAGPVTVTVQGGMTVSGATENGFLWILDSPADREREQNNKTNRAVREYIDPSTPWGRLSNPKGLNEAIIEHQYSELVRLQNVDRVVTKVSKSGQVTLGASALGGSAEVSIGADAVRTIEQDRSGPRSITFEVNAAAGGELGALLFGESAAGAEAKFTVAVSLDDRGEIEAIDITGIQGVRLGGNADGDTGRLADAVGEVRDHTAGAAIPLFGQVSETLGKYLAPSFEYTNRDEATGALRTQVHIDPRASGLDRQNLAEFLNKPTLGNTRKLLGDPALQANTIDVQLYRGEQHTEDLTAKLQLGPGLGGSSSSETKRLGISDAWTISPNGVQHRTDCLRR